MSDITTKEISAFSFDPLSEEQQTAFGVLREFGLTAERALEMVWIFRPTEIIEQAEKLMHVRHIPSSGLVLFRLIETAQRRAEQFARRAAERFTQEYEQRQNQKDYLSSLKWGQSMLMTARGSLYRIVGQTESMGAPALLVECDGAACKIPLSAAMDRYELIL